MRSVISDKCYKELVSDLSEPEGVPATLLKIIDLIEGEIKVDLSSKKIDIVSTYIKTKIGNGDYSKFSESNKKEIIQITYHSLKNFTCKYFI